MKLALVTLLLFLGLAPLQQVKLVKTKVHDAITMSLPGDFVAMSQPESSKAADTVFDATSTR